MDAELIIVGAGPAGVSAALWARSRDLEPVLIERAPFAGGRLHDVHFHPRELPGVTVGDGPALASSFEEQLRAERIAFRRGVAVEWLRLDAQRPVVGLAGGEGLRAEAVLLAVGTRRRRLDVPGERELEDRGVSRSATRDGDQLSGKRVAVVGGGDAAYENALILARMGCDVVLLVRGEPTARREFQERVASEGSIGVHERTTVTAIEGDARVTGVRVMQEDATVANPHASAAERARRFDVEAVVIKVGEVPNTECCVDAVELDSAGYVVVDPRGRTSSSRVWAAGDVTRPALPGISVAYGTAALAVADIRSALRG